MRLRSSPKTNLILVKMRPGGSCLNDNQTALFVLLHTVHTRDIFVSSVKSFPDVMSYWAAKLGRWCLRRQCSTVAHYDTSQFRPRRAVVLTKVSRYEFEKIRHESLSEKQLELELTARGSNYAAIRHHHNIHKVDAEYWLLCIDLIYNINSHFFIFFCLSVVGSICC